MKQAIIDIGSNSMRLTAYDVSGTTFKVLFRERIMAGLAGYISHGVLSSDGIECACSGLLEFKETLVSLAIANVHVFATAALRNISNTAEAVATIDEVTKFKIEVISSKDEALMGYYGAMRELNISDGSFVDIGGASTEIVTFEKGQPLESVSLALGSLSLYQSCVKKILPGDGSIKRMNEAIKKEMKAHCKAEHEKRSPMVCVGGTARVVLKIAKKLYKLPANCQTLTAAQVNNLYEILSCRDRTATNLILRQAPDRIHTIVPGLLILKHMLAYFEAETIVVSNYGVREGYLCQKILNTAKSDISTPKTEN